MRLVVLPVFVAGLLAAEPDPRMVPPANAVREKLPHVPAIPAGEAAKTFQVLDGFRMDLLAAEPVVTSPVAMAYDENGRAYVCEMRDYPYTDKARHQRNQENPTDAPIGVIRLLEDRDGDGAFEHSTVFADGLSWPTGVACWKGGVFVAATPDIWYLKDTNGDGVADIRRQVFTGFRKLNVQSVMNNLVWGLDNRIYGAGGSNGGQIRHAQKPDAKPLAMSRQDFRFDPVTEKFELISGGARFGGTFDDWGHRFLCDIRNPAQHIVLPQHYLARNAHLPARSVLHDMAEAGDQLPVFRISQPELWRVLRAKRWAGERDMVMPRSELIGAGVVTSSSGITVYRGAAYPEKYRGNIFVCEVAGNLFYRLELTQDGPTFKAARVDSQAEMVASTDNWFRPVNFVNAPDGTLHVVDMYRENIEHPWSIPDDIHAAVDLENGRDRGRIWRLTPPHFRPSQSPRLGAATTADLVSTLENPNSWWRETAQRLLLERQDKAAVAELRTLTRQSKSAQARLHALWTLHGLDSLTEADILAGLRDQHPGVRENAIKLAEDFLGADATTATDGAAAARASIVGALLNLASDPDPAVRFQLAFTVGEIRDPRAIDALHAIAHRDANDAWTRTAILSSVANSSDQLLLRILDAARLQKPNVGESKLARELAQILGVRGKTAEMESVLSTAWRKSGERHKPGDEPGADISDVIAFGIGEGLKRSGKNLRTIAWTAETANDLDQHFRDKSRAATNSNRSVPLARLPAIQFLAFDNFDRVKPTLARLLHPAEPQEIQVAAVRAIATFSQAEIAEILLSVWRGSAPAVRAEIISALLNHASRVLPLLQAIDSGAIPANQVPFARRAALFRNGNAQIRELAQKLFGAAASLSRKEVTEKYQAALALKGAANRGKIVFETACATCHRAGDVGKDVGPNLATIRQWNPEQILLNILDPNREVAANFLGYTIETKEGRTIDGIITDEGASSITVKAANETTEVILRSDIAHVFGSGLSLMPEGLEAGISVEQMADLLAFLTAAQ